MKKYLLIALMAGLSPLLAEEATIEFQGSLPAESQWQNSGGLPVKSEDIDGVKALAFVDDSESGIASIKYPINKMLQGEMLSEGYTINISLKHLIDSPGNGNFNFVVRLPGIRSVIISPWGDGTKKTLQVGLWDSETEKHKSAVIPYRDEFVNIRITVRPVDATEANLELQLQDEEPIVIKLGPDKNALKSMIEMGGSEMSSDKVGSTYVESFKLTVP